MKKNSDSAENSNQRDDPEALRRFDELVRKVLFVPPEEILRREEEYKRQAALNPNKRGPKPKAKKR